jgi:hypothetical protein
MSATRAELSKGKIKKDPPLRITSDDSRKRAKHCRLAAALTDIPRDSAMFNDLAMRFDQIFGRAEGETSPIALSRSIDQPSG